MRSAVVLGRSPAAGFALGAAVLTGASSTAGARASVAGSATTFFTREAARISAVDIAGGSTGFSAAGGVVVAATAPALLALAAAMISATDMLLRSFAGAAAAG